VEAIRDSPGRPHARRNPLSRALVRASSTALKLAYMKRVRVDQAHASNTVGDDSFLPGSVDSASLEPVVHISEHDEPDAKVGLSASGRGAQR
jgi:hypothetical protein